MATDEEVTTAVNAATTVAKECLDAGMYASSKAFKKLTVFVELGLVIRTAIGLANRNQDDPVIQKIEEMKNTIDKIEDKMKNHFGELKAFVTEHDFYNDVPLSAALLNQFLLDSLRHPSDVSRARFQKEYEALPPLELSRRLQHQLMKSATNPLKMAMSADPMMSTATFEKWSKILDAVFTQLMVLEAYACGLLHGKNLHYLNKTRKEFELFDKRLKTWQHDYKTHAHFWPQNIIPMVHEVQDDNKLDSHIKKAEAIRDKMDTIMTNHSFYVVVYDKNLDRVAHTSLPSQVIESLDRNGCSIIVYQCTKFHEEPKKLETFKNTAKIYKKVRWMVSQYEFVSEDRLKTWAGVLKDSGMLMLLRMRGDDKQAVRFTHEKSKQESPGAHFEGYLHSESDSDARTVSDNDEPSKRTAYYLVAGFH